MAAETVELHKLKLAELKQECLARGLETKGIKQDLINRLQAYLEEHAEEEANEEDVLGDETEEEEPKPIELPVKEEEPPEKNIDVAAEKKVVKITSEIPQTERMQKRAERFNVPVSLESKKAARAARFGISSVPTKGLSSDTKPTLSAVSWESSRGWPRYLDPCTCVETLRNLLAPGFGSAQLRLLRLFGE
ncbi:SAP domain-containing ribonucleoprotein isoform X4 [Oryctolagus cuniculus]|uniref:SAP domain-containing ribonucleoprotein isoform X4 n=1 Tax=Oryctolagus cuniculus TaxID=9986 RepID=UPI003879C0DB